ncbi:MAG: Holliday junction resolvase RuvX [Bacteroidota bacterium]
MPRILAIDYGKKRTGLAWTDPLQLIASGLGTVDTVNLEQELAQRLSGNEVEAVVLGYPTRMDGSDSHVTEDVRKLADKLRKQYPAKEVHLWDERFTSQLAVQAMIDAGLKKKKRRDKKLIDQISATIILQEFLESQ